MSHRWQVSLVIALTAAVYLIGNGRVALWDRDEPRNAQAARQMLQSGDWVVPHFLDKVRTAKPPFTNWCQAAAMAVFGENSFSARFPSAIAMTLTLIVLACVIGRLFDRERAFWTVLVLSTSALVIAWSARSSLTDSVLLLWITIAQICQYAMWRGNTRWPVVVIMAIAVGLAGLTKGPVVLGVMGMTLATLWLGRLTRILPAPWGEVRWSDARAGRPSHAGLFALKLGVACLIVAAIITPWMVLVEHRAPGFLWTTASRDVVQRVFEPLEQHKGPPGYYFLMLWGIYFPWSVLLPLTFVMAWRYRDEPIIRFCLAATVGPWIMLECVQTKLPHYLLPIFPPLAFLTADAIVRCLRREHDDLTTRGTRGAIVAWGVIVVLIAALPWLAIGRFDGAPVAATVAFTIVGIAYAALVIVFMQRRRPGIGLITMALGMMAAMAIAFGWYLPAARFIRLPVGVADILIKNGGGAKDTLVGDVQMIQYKEPSLAFYQGGTIREQGENDFLVTTPFEKWPKWTVIREDIWARMPKSVTDRMDVVGTCRGVNLADQGKTYTVYVLRKR